jgi:hypothetical protein
MNLREEIKIINGLSNFLSNKTILSESKLDDLLKYYENKFNDEYNGVIEDFYDGDPSATKKYFNWMSKVFIERDQKNLGIEINDLLLMVNYFDKNQHKFEKKDIYQYSYEEFVQKYEEAITKITKKELELSGVEKLYEDDKYVLVRPKNKEASCKYGSNTKWCISSNTNNYFDNYSDGNLFFFVIDKLREPISGKKKSKNYFKIAIQYSPTTSDDWRQKEVFLRNSKNGDFAFWNAIDEEVKPETIKKYIGRDLLKLFYNLIVDYTYNLYSKYYDQQYEKEQKFNESKYYELEKLLDEKNKVLKTAKKSYNATKSVRFVKETLELYDSVMNYYRVMKIEAKSFDKFLEFNEIKDKYYDSLKIKEDLDKKLKNITYEVNNLQSEFNKIRDQADDISSYINFGKI